eukprot:TRINITY_DN1559_c0_g1_i2.p1 TRINITY_DN1559_c0_g1~~TRINITY_DN1559_c0_g1_i2.p1  ORF type:complete len:263 (+),score=26.53 TRINITY_DN1559_c0_g1_i2:63-851(+)
MLYYLTCLVSALFMLVTCASLKKRIDSRRSFMDIAISALSALFVVPVVVIWGNYGLRMGLWAGLTVFLIGIWAALALLMCDTMLKKSFKMAILLGVALLVMDVPMSRTKYNTCIEHKVKAVVEKYKEDLASVKSGLDPADYDGSILERAETAVCEGATLAAEKRQSCIYTIRDAHPISKAVSEVFDLIRGVDQSTKVKNLSLTRSCSQRLESSTRSNANANFIAIAAGCYCLLVFVFALKSFLENPFYNTTPESPSNGHKSE